MKPIGSQKKSEMEFARNAFDDLTDAVHPAPPSGRGLSDRLANVGLREHGGLQVVKPMEL